MTDTDLISQKFERLNLPQGWRDAVDALQGIKQVGVGWNYTGKHDVKPLAQMLSSGEPVPPYVAKIISIHLAPPKGRWCGRLIFKKPPTSAINFWKNKRRDQNARIYFENLRRKGEKYDVAIARVAEKYRLSKGWAKNLRPLNEDRDIAEAMKRLDPETFKP